MNLDFEIGQQGEDGSWSPNFSWDDQDPEAWQTAKKEWQSRITVDTLKTLKDFGRIEQEVETNAAKSNETRDLS